MKQLIKYIAGVAVIATAFAFTVTVSAAPPTTAPGKNKLQCFDGTTDGGFGGTCTLNSSGAKGAATLDLTSSSPTGDYAGVYTLESKLYGTQLTNLTQLSYQYTSSV